MNVVPAGRLAYGIQLPVQSQSSLYAQPWERQAGPDAVAAMARVADEAGFLYVAVCDHVAIPRRLAGAMGTTWYDPMPTLGWLAAQTTRVRLLSHVYVLAFRHPLVAAKGFATLDALSGGRAVVGIGAGHVPEEFAELGVDFEGRGRVLEEGLEVLKLALAEEFAVADLGQRPRPVQQPRPPIWIGGSSPAAVRRAALLADGWLPQGDPRPELRVKAQRIRRLREDNGLPPAEIGAVTEFIDLVGSAAERKGPTLDGGADAIAERLREFADMGVSHLQVRFPSSSLEEQLDQMRAFGDQVAPMLTR